MPLLFHPRCDGRDVPDRAAAPAPGWRLASRRPLARLGALLAASLLIGACAQTRPGAEAAPAGPAVGTPVPAAQANAVAQRIGWGLNPSQAAQVARLGLPRYLQQQLDPGRDAALPPAVAAQIAALDISQHDGANLAREMAERRKQADSLSDDDAKAQARKAYQQAMNQLARQAATRSVLRALYSPRQLQENLTWFWLNHFSVHQGKADLRALVGDYEERAIRPHVLGRFRDLLAATLHHPAMVLFLDNQQNAAGKINENYARELMELHTLGVGGGYSQRDVQELARVLTGVGVSLKPGAPRLRPALQPFYQRQGLWEFNPARHDFGDKTLLGHTIRGSGPAELDQVIDLLSRQPATSRFISHKLAQYFVADEPPPALVERMAATFRQTDGDIAATLRTLFTAPEFLASLAGRGGGQFKDPVHYVLSAVRLTCDGAPDLNAEPVLGWLARLAEPLYGRQTPDGYPLVASAWSSPGQMATRFDVAKAIGTGRSALLRTSAQAPGTPAPTPPVPVIDGAFFRNQLEPTLGAATRAALGQARSPAEWNTLLLASPEFMLR